jgi:hypothetical protein
VLLHKVSTQKEIAVANPAIGRPGPSVPLGIVRLRANPADPRYRLTDLTERMRQVPPARATIAAKALHHPRFCHNRAGVGPPRG